MPGFSEEDVKDLALRLRSGMLPSLSGVRAEPIPPEPWLVTLRVGLLATALAFAVSLVVVVLRHRSYFRGRPADA